MSAFSELRDGRPADEFVSLVARTVRAVAIARNFPPPEGHDGWDRDAVSTTTAAFFASSQTPRRLADLSLRCTSDKGLHHLLQTTIRNFLADLGRRTEVGRLVLRINEVLGDDPAFERDGDAWWLVGSTGERAQEDVDDLVAVASRVQVDVPSAWQKSSRKSPDIDKASVVRLATALLTHAGGPLRPSVLAQVAARRLGIGQTAMTVDATAFDPPTLGGISVDATADDVVLGVRAEEVFKLLNDNERVAIGLPDLSAAALGGVLHVGKSTAAIIRSRAVSVIRAELEREDNGQEIADMVLNMARTWASTWTAGSDATY